MAGRKPTAARFTRMTTLPSPTSRWRISSTSIRTSTPSRRLAASRSSCRTPTRRRPRSTRTRSPPAAIALVVADTLPVQIDLMKKGLSFRQVGQCPLRDGHKAMYFLKDMQGRQSRRRRTRPIPASRPELCTPKTADTLRWRRQLNLRRVDTGSASRRPFFTRTSPRSGRRSRWIALRASIGAEDFV